MIKYLLIGVLVSHDDIQGLVTNIIGFCQNTLENGMFDCSTDQFVIYLEDLYPRMNSPTQTVEFGLIKFFSQHPHIKYKITNNQMRQIIPDFCKKESLVQRITDRDIPLESRHETSAKIEKNLKLRNLFYDTGTQQLLTKRTAITQKSSDPYAFQLYTKDLAKHLDLFYQIAQIAVGPTLIKELIQPFCLYYESAIEVSRCVTMYCDMDMRYDNMAMSPSTSPRSLFADPDIRNYYLSIPHSMLTLRASSKDPITRNITSLQHDVFWAINNGDQDPVFLVCFYNILYFAITHTYWKKALIDEDKSTFEDLSKLEKLKSLILHRHDMFEECEKPHNSSTKLFEVARLDLSRVNGDRLQNDTLPRIEALYKIRSIINLHFGSVRVPPFSKVDNVINDIIKTDLTVNTLFKSYYPNYADHAPKYPDRYISRTTVFSKFFMDAYRQPFKNYFLLKQTASPQKGIQSSQILFPYGSPFFDLFSRTYNSNNELFSVFYSYDLKLKKQMMGRWTRVPILSAQDMKEIVLNYPFMYNALLVTTPLRDLAVNYDSTNPQNSIQRFLINQLDIITSVIHSSPISKLRLYPNSQMPLPGQTEQDRLCVICQTSNTTQCPECGAVICATHNRPNISEYLCHIDKSALERDDDDYGSEKDSRRGDEWSSDSD